MGIQGWRRRNSSVEEPQEAARRLARAFLSGQLSAVAYLRELHTAVGHQGPQALQDLVELDDDYPFGQDPSAGQRFCDDRVMELLVGRAREIV